MWGGTGDIEEAGSIPATYPRHETSVPSGTDTASGHCYPITITTTTTISTDTTTITVTTAITLLHSNILMNGQYITTGDNNRAKEIMNGNDTMATEIDNAVQDVSSSHSSGNNSSPGRSRNIDLEINSTKDESDRKNYLKKEEMEKREERMEEKDIIRSPPIKLIRKPSEEGFHQIVKFTKRVTRRGKTEIPESKSFTHTEFNDQKKSLSVKEDLCAVSVRKDLANLELDNCTICIEQNLSSDIQPRLEYCDPTDKILLGSAHSDDDISTESKFLSCESICAKSKETDKTMVVVDDLSQSVQKQQDQQKYDETENYLEIGGPKTADNKSKMFV